MPKISRRQALKIGLSSAAYYTLSPLVPGWLTRTAYADFRCLAEDRILVVLQLEGGIDGLNTVVPVEDDAYYRARPKLAVPKNAALDVGEPLNRFHPGLAKLSNWYRDGHMGVLHNIGYPNPNLSHFTSTEHYMRGTAPDGPQTRQGWLWRFHGNACDGTGEHPSRDMVAIGTNSIPEAMYNPVPDERFGSQVYTPPAVEDASRYTVESIPNYHIDLMDAIAKLNALPSDDLNLAFLRKTAATLEVSMEDVAKARKLGSSQEYPNGKLGKSLQLVSQIIRAGFKTPIFYVSQTGYDTHAGQVFANDTLNGGDHPRLLRELDLSLDAFLSEMKQSGFLDNVLIMTFSEFGRRVEENGSFGTDHGAGNSFFVLGGGVKGGVYGAQPNLLDLNMGSLRHDTDFRALYGKVLRDWLGATPTTIFPQEIIKEFVTPSLPVLDFL